MSLPPLLPHSDSLLYPLKPLFCLQVTFGRGDEEKQQQQVRFTAEIRTSVSRDSSTQERLQRKEYRGV